METARQEQTTLKTDLDVIVKEGLDIFDPGAPGEGVTAVSGPATDRKVEDDATKAKADADAKVKADADAKAKADAEVEAAKAAGFRFTSHGEAERGYKESQKVITSLSEKTKTLEQENLGLKNAEQRKKDTAAAGQAFEEFATTRNVQALNEIDKLDPDDKDYRKNVAAAWARANRDIREYVAPAPAAPAPAPAAAAPAGPAASPDPAQVQKDLDEIKNYAGSIISKPENGGFDPNDILFWSIASQAPSVNEKGEPIPLDDQIKWALNQTNKYLSSKGKGMSEADRIAEANRKAEDRARTEMPLGRSASERSAAVRDDEDRPLSLSDAVTQTLEMRRL
jgi:hypothetical protein